MAESTSVFNTPVLWINTYLQEKIPEFVKQVGGDQITDFTNSQGIGVPFFPSRPTSIDEITEQWVVINDERYPYSGIMATWDRLVRMRRSPFPHIKQEQLLYYFYATQENVTEQMVQVQETVLRLMDREDETAQEINSWASKHDPIDGMSCKFKFHRFKVYQLEEVRDIIDFGTARTYGGNKIIIDFEYHQDSDIASQIF
jgi:hypothetical protein